LLETPSGDCDEGSPIALFEFTFVGLGCIGIRDRVHQSSIRESNYRPCARLL
jgi:hypothetical protein